MDRLYLDTKNGKLPIDPGVAEKYNLNRGSKSPYTNDAIVDRTGSAAKAPQAETPGAQLMVNKEKYANDELSEYENGLVLDTAEVLDIAQAADSRIEPD